MFRTIMGINTWSRELRHFDIQFYLLILLNQFVVEELLLEMKQKLVEPMSLIFRQNRRLTAVPMKTVSYNRFAFLLHFFID